MVFRHGQTGYSGQMWFPMVGLSDPDLIKEQTQ